MPIVFADGFDRYTQEAAKSSSWSEFNEQTSFWYHYRTTTTYGPWGFFVNREDDGRGFYQYLSTSVGIDQSLSSRGSFSLSQGQTMKISFYTYNTAYITDSFSLSNFSLTNVRSNLLSSSQSILPFCFNPAIKFFRKSSSTWVTAGSVTALANMWNHIEIIWYLHGTEGRLKIVVNGNEVGSFEGEYLDSANYPNVHFYFGYPPGYSFGYSYVDDFVLSIENSKDMTALGPLQVRKLDYEVLNYEGFTLNGAGAGAPIDALRMPGDGRSANILSSQDRLNIKANLLPNTKALLMTAKGTDSSFNYIKASVGSNPLSLTQRGARQLISNSNTTYSDVLLIDELNDVVFENSTDTEYQNVVSMFDFKGWGGQRTIIDNSSKQKLWRFNSDVSARITKLDGVLGLNSAYFDGASTAYWYTSSTISDFMLPGDFTIDFWVKSQETTAVTGRHLMGQYNASTGSWAVAHSDNVIKFQTYVGGFSTVLQSTTAMAAGTWYHVAIVRSAGTLRIYIDGIKEAEATNNVNYTSAATTFYLGQSGPSLANAFKGWIADYRLTKGVGRYVANFTPPTTPNSYRKYSTYIELKAER